MSQLPITNNNKVKTIDAYVNKINELRHRFETGNFDGIDYETISRILNTTVNFEGKNKKNHYYW